MLFNPISVSGRISRPAWWLSNSVLTALGIMQFIYGFELSWNALGLMLILGWVGICVNVKRYHDINKSGFWVLISFIPIIGTIWMCAELGFVTGDKGENRFGPPPSGRHDVADTPSRFTEMSDEEFREMAKRARSEPEAVAAVKPVVQRVHATIAPPSAPIFGRRSHLCLAQEKHLAHECLHNHGSESAHQLIRKKSMGPDPG